MKHYGDITKINGADVEPVWIITGGSPCQDLSVAGKRAGLAGERSGLFMEQIRIIKEMREHDKSIGRSNELIRPRYMVWENVPGAFSSNKGEDFRAVLEETAKVADKDAYVPGLEGGKWSPCGCILGNGWSIAWRLHDAQYWGVPQRRKRICLLADFNGDTAGKVLFELQRKTTNRDTKQAVVDIGIESRSEVQSVSKGLSGDIAQGGKEGERIAEDTERGAGEASATAFEPGAMSRVGGHAYEDVAGTVRANAGDNQQAVVYGIGSYDSNAMKSSNPHSGIYEADTARTLDLNGGSPACNQGGMAVVQGADVWTGSLTGDKAATLTSACGSTNATGPKVIIGADMYNNALTGDVAATLNAHSGANATSSGPSVICIEGNGSRESHKGDGYKESDTVYTLNTVEQHAVCIENHPADSRVKIEENGICQTLSSRMGTGGGNVPMVMETYQKTTGRASYNQGENAKYNFSVDEEKVGAQVAKGPGAICDVVVRRLTPLECERLQGYPDGWTDIGDWVDSKGKKHKGDADSPRYKALGNSIALPFWQWMAERMCKYLNNPTMASLFDGIGGFPLVFKRCGCIPVWASEIEEFPIAVTKIRFPEYD